MNKQKYIKAPYNFVPLSEKVFYPDWADMVSHDVPFSDGESGVIEVTLKAETPVFIRNTDLSNGDDKESSSEFCHYVDRNGQKQYYIPGTSVKGMIRSVLEIMSFGKIKVDNQEIDKKCRYNAQKLAENYQEEKTNGPDLSDLIFGFINSSEVKDKSERGSLKGRVQFSPFHACNTVTETDLISLVLGNPKPKYVPIYIKQEGLQGVITKRKYQDYNSLDSVISGYKRYPVRSSIDNEAVKLSISTGNEEVITKMKPLDAGTEFKGKIRFHNLRKIEIGALLSALSFHDQNNHLKHSIGLAKPYGFGVVSLDFHIINELKFSFANYLSTYEELMEKEIQSWWSSPQLKELFLMADQLSAESLERPLEYMKFDTESSQNDFSKAKKKKEYLLPYSEYTSNRKNSTSVGSEAKINEQKKEQKINELLNRFDDFFELQKFDEAKETIDKAMVLYPKHKNILQKDMLLQNALEKKQAIQALSEKLDEKMINEKWNEAMAVVDELIEIEPAAQLWKDKRDEIRSKQNISIAKTQGIDFVLKKCKGKDIKALNGQLETYIKRGGVINLDDYDQIYEAIVSSYSCIKKKKEREEWFGNKVHECKAWERIHSKWLKDESQLNALFERFQKEQNL